MPDHSENQVGYKTPPKAFQFQKGRSGNPRGRPPKDPGIRELLGKVCRQKVLANGKNGPKRMSKLEASVTQLVNKAASGDLKAAKLLMQMLQYFPEIVRNEDMKVDISRVQDKLLAAIRSRRSGEASRR